MAHFHRVTVTSTILIIENDNALNTKLRHYRRDRRKMTGAISISLEKQTITYLWWYSKYRWQYTLHQQFFLKWKHYGKEFYENIGRERARSSKCMWFMHTVFFLLEGMVVVNTLQQPYIPWKMVWIAKEGKTSQVYLAKKIRRPTSNTTAWELHDLPAWERRLKDRKLKKRKRSRWYFLPVY